MFTTIFTNHLTIENKNENKNEKKKDGILPSFYLTTNDKSVVANSFVCEGRSPSLQQHILKITFNTSVLLDSAFYILCNLQKSSQLIYTVLICTHQLLCKRWHFLIFLLHRIYAFLQRVHSHIVTLNEHSCYVVI